MRRVPAPCPWRAIYEVRAEGVYLLPEATGITGTDKLWVSYSYGDYAVIEKR